MENWNVVVSDGGMATVTGERNGLTWEIALRERRKGTGDLVATSVTVTANAARHLTDAAMRDLPTRLVRDAVNAARPHLHQFVFTSIERLDLAPWLEDRRGRGRTDLEKAQLARALTSCATYLPSEIGEEVEGDPRTALPIGRARRGVVGQVWEHRYPEGKTASGWEKALSQVATEGFLTEDNHLTEHAERVLYGEDFHERIESEAAIDEEARKASGIFTPQEDELIRKSGVEPGDVAANAGDRYRAMLAEDGSAPRKPPTLPRKPDEPP